MKYFEKLSGYNLSDVESHLGFYLRDKDEPYVRRLASEQLKKRFPLRHPFLTGIPTLGIAPAISKSLANEEVARKMVKKDSWIRKEVKSARKLKAREEASAAQRSMAATQNAQYINDLFR